MNENFARYWLKLSPYRLRNSDASMIPTFTREMVKFAEYNYPIKITKPTIILGVNQIKVEKVKPLRVSYDDLIRAGLVITSKPTNRRWFKGQRQIYGLARKYNIPSNVRIKNQLPIYHYIEYDRLEKKFRLVGRNTSPFGYGEWV